ncbi:hypothetical protein EVAR_28401_1 [Eumeta japonica]|uniref:Uncharacterized protein n=1 Tax=Eumeta variegata TaxID=151549 RepID=A0A4C1XDZ0_EUMVA|nr:hypothetical protein EVAR_28401_1 [Eumeta japonica]
MHRQRDVRGVSAAPSAGADGPAAVSAGRLGARLHSTNCLSDHRQLLPLCIRMTLLILAQLASPGHTMRVTITDCASVCLFAHIVEMTKRIFMRFSRVTHPLGLEPNVGFVSLKSDFRKNHIVDLA